MLYTDSVKHEFQARPNLHTLAYLKKTTKGKSARIGGLGRRKSLLSYDSFEAHVTNTVNASFKRENTELAVIPGGLTSLL